MCQWLPSKVPKAFVWDVINSADLSQFQRVYKFLTSQDLTLPGELLSKASSRA
jgi:hypothetical protein